jgi:MoaA/NifB/PqqE/SkfB family radical SAM enzyme
MKQIREFLEQFGDAIENTAGAAQVKALPPEELHFELTYRCNTSCVMCNLRYLGPGKDELTLSEIEKAVNRSLLLSGIRFIVLSGGEPWLREDLADIVKFLRGKYPDSGVLILSNLIDGELVAAGLERIRAAAGLANISIGSSLDGIGPAHDHVRGRAGSFEALAGSLVMLREKYPELYVSLNFTLTPDNADQMVPVYNWCSVHNYHVSFQALVQKKETRQFAWEQKHVAVIDEQIGCISDDLCRRNGVRTEAQLLSNEGLLSLLLSLHYIVKYLRQPKRYFPACPCGEKYAMIDPRGNLYFCPVHKGLIAGNMQDHDFDGAWLSPKAELARDFFNTRECHCWLTCTNGFMLESAIKSGKNVFMRKYFNAGKANAPEGK